MVTLHCQDVLGSSASLDVFNGRLAEESRHSRDSGRKRDHEWIYKRPEKILTIWRITVSFIQDTGDGKVGERCNNEWEFSIRINVDESKQAQRSQRHRLAY